VADRREPASDLARREHCGDGDGRLEDHTELGRGRNRGPRHTPCHATQHGGASGLDDHRTAGSHVSMVSHPAAAIDAILAAVAAIDD